jgi:hypothetical protein
MRSDITKLTVASPNFANPPKRLPIKKHDDNPSIGSQFAPKRRAGGHKQTIRNDTQTDMKKLTVAFPNCGISEGFA